MRSIKYILIFGLAMKALACPEDGLISLGKPPTEVINKESGPRTGVVHVEVKTGAEIPSLEKNPVAVLAKGSAYEKEALQFINYLGALGYKDTHLHTASGAESLVFIATNPAGVRVVIKRPKADAKFFYERFFLAVEQEQKIYQEIKDQPGAKHIILVSKVTNEGVPYAEYSMAEGLTLIDHISRAKAGGKGDFIIKNEQTSPHLFHEETSTQEVLRYMREYAEGLAALHSKGWIHNDVKPSNMGLIWRNGRYEAAWLDMGIAVRKGNKAPIGIDPSKIAVTKEYAPQERINGEAPDYWHDNWALAQVYKEVMKVTLASDRKPLGSPDELMDRNKLKLWTWEGTVKQALQGDRRSGKKGLLQDLQDKTITLDQFLQKIKELEAAEPK